MTEEEFRADLLAAVASRAEVEACASREAFVLEMLERLFESGEVPDAETCVEALTGQRGRKLEIDAWAMDEADGSLHLFVAIWDGRSEYPASITLTDAREQGFNRVLGVFEQSRSGWLTDNIEESRPLWALARHIQLAPRPTALRVHVLTDRPISERLREIAGEQTRENVPVTFQIWDVTRLKRIHTALSVRDDLVVDFSRLDGGGLQVLPASVGSGDYDGYLTVIPGEVLADIYLRHGSRLLEGNVRTFLGRSGKVNKGIAATVAKEPAKFFAYNNGIAATASEVTTARRGDGSIIVVSAMDLQIVNGAQTTASLASAARDKTLVGGTIFVPMKLSVVTPTVASDLIPLISRFVNSQNGVRPSDFFANHAFHRRIEEVSRRILAPAVAGSQVQTHWYYERARGQHLNDQAGFTLAKRNQFLLINPRRHEG
jgi:AIPR protein/abortive infection phage resistance-like protein